MSRLSSTNNYLCFFKAVEEEGSAFGGCSCGYPKTHRLPCHHMMVLVKSCCIEGLNCVNSMPPWWMTTHWRKQYPKGTHVYVILTWRSFGLLCRLQILPTLRSSEQGRASSEENKLIKSALEVATENKQSKQKKVKGTIGKVDGNLKSPPLFEVVGKITSVERSGVERSAERGERMMKEDVVRKI